MIFALVRLHDHFPAASGAGTAMEDRRQPDAARISTLATPIGSAFDAPI